MRKIILICSIAFWAMSCGGNKKTESSSTDGAKIFKLNCALCHGMDGKLGANGSKDLTVSPLTMDDRIGIIKNGKGAMAAYEAILSKEEIKAVAEYTFSLK